MLLIKSFCRWSLCALVAVVSSLLLSGCSSDKETGKATRSTTTSVAEAKDLKFDACGFQDFFKQSAKLTKAESAATVKRLLASKKEFVAAVPDELKPNAQSMIEFYELVAAKKPMDKALTDAQPKNIDALKTWSKSECK